MTGAKERPTRVHRKFLTLSNGKHFYGTGGPMHTTLRADVRVKDQHFYGMGGSLNHTRSFGIQQQFGYVSWTLLRAASWASDSSQLNSPSTGFNERGSLPPFLDSIQLLRCRNVIRPFDVS